MVFIWSWKKLEESGFSERHLVKKSSGFHKSPVCPYGAVVVYKITLLDKLVRILLTEPSFTLLLMSWGFNYFWKSLVWPLVIIYIKSLWQTIFWRFIWHWNLKLKRWWVTCISLYLPIFSCLLQVECVQ